MSSVRVFEQGTLVLPLVYCPTITRIFGDTLPLTAFLHTGQVGKVLGERWKALSEEQRQQYEAAAAADKQRYEDEKAAYHG